MQSRAQSSLRRPPPPSKANSAAATHADKPSVIARSGRFVQQTADSEAHLKKESVGLVRLEQFQRIKDAIERGEKKATGVGVGQAGDPAMQHQPPAKPKRGVVRATLSFGDDDEVAADAEDPTSTAATASTADKQPTGKRRRRMKDPLADTSFLADEERDAAQLKEMEALQREYVRREQEIKSENFTVACAFWDGAGHRARVTVKKGCSIGAFLEAAKKQFKQIEHIAIDHLIFAKENVILPHHFTFYELIVNKARGKTGPLFDGCKTAVTAAEEPADNDEHLGKIVEVAWYEKNRQSFPVNRWSTYEPSKDYGRYLTVTTTTRK